MFRLATSLRRQRTLTVHRGIHDNARQQQENSNTGVRQMTHSNNSSMGMALPGLLAEARMPAAEATGGKDLLATSTTAASTMNGLEAMASTEKSTGSSNPLVAAGMTADTGMGKDKMTITTHHEATEKTGTTAVTAITTKAAATGISHSSTAIAELLAGITAAGEMLQGWVITVVAEQKEAGGEGIMTLSVRTGCSSSSSTSRHRKHPSSVVLKQLV